MYYCVSMYSTYHVFSVCLFGCCCCFLFTLFDGNVEWNYGFKFSFKHCSNDNNGRQEREKSNVEWVRELNMKKTRNDDDNITLTVTTMQTHIQILASRTKLFISMNLIGFFPLPPSFSTHCVDRLKSAGWFCVLFFLLSIRLSVSLSLNGSIHSKFISCHFGALQKFIFMRLAQVHT